MEVVRRMWEEWEECPDAVPLNAPATEEVTARAVEATRMALDGQQPAF